jgi:2-haloacid dehalogenase
MKTVVFDVGGVLLDWDPEYLYRKLIPDDGERAHFLRDVCPREWNARADAGLSWPDAVAERISLYPDKAELIRAYDTRWPEMVSGQLHDVVAIKDELRDKGIPLYAITNFSSQKWRLSQTLWPTLADFDGVVVSGDEKLLKPDPRIYQVLFDRYGLAPADCLFIDDVPANIDGAKHAGMAGHVFTSASSLRQALQDFL